MAWVQDVAHSDADIVVFAEEDVRPRTIESLVETRVFQVRAGVITFTLPAVLAVRRAALEETPLDPAMEAFALHEWCYRTNGVVLAPPEAAQPRARRRRGDSDDERRSAAPLLAPIAHFYRKHGLVMNDVFSVAPELTDTRSARLLLELVSARGVEWIAEQWVEGELGPLFKKRYKRPLEWWERRPAK
ncbi:MAG TPA: hypothetical protein VGR02_04550 [Thermoanaerobaculia bacterium]|jgi:hypothetical protein|nr:hypothetical protein [Thermoanaerobaculia bacterium]